jgi:hypothetical protein
MESQDIPRKIPRFHWTLISRVTRVRTRLCPVSKYMELIKTILGHIILTVTWMTAKIFIYIELFDDQFCPLKWNFEVYIPNLS